MTRALLATLAACMLLTCAALRLDDRRLAGAAFGCSVLAFVLSERVRRTRQD